MKEHKSNYIYGYDESQKIGHAYGATNTPQFFVLDKERKIRYLGAMDDNQDEAKVKKTYLKDAVEALLKGETPAGRRDPPAGLRREVQEELSALDVRRGRFETIADRERRDQFQSRRAERSARRRLS